MNLFARPWQRILIKHDRERTVRISLQWKYVIYCVVEQAVDAKEKLPQTPYRPQGGFIGIYMYIHIHTYVHIYICTYMFMEIYAEASIR